MEQPAGAEEVRVVPSGKAAGAEIRGVDIAKGVSAQAMSVIKDALHTWKAVVLRGQRITPAQQVAFSSAFGRLERHVLPQFLLPGHEELVRVSNILDDEGKPIGLVDAGQIWHSDGHFLETPNLYSMLYAIEIPHDDEGNPLGATRFANTQHAYETLPDAMKQRIAGLRAGNSLANVYRVIPKTASGSRAPLTEAQKREAIHPVVRTHPVTGAKCLYVTRAATGRIVGMDAQEGAALIDELADHILREESIYTHAWQVGDVLIWDNCGAQHLAIGDYRLPQRRLLHRTTVAGAATF